MKSMVDIDKYMRCIAKPQTLQNGEVIEGHNYRPLLAFIEGSILHLPMRCKYCGFYSDAEKVYEGETASEVYGLYGFRLDESGNQG